MSTSHLEENNSSPLLTKIYGAGPPVLLIPGFASRANNWGMQYRALKKDFKVITVEKNGNGDLGQCDGGDYRIDLIAAELYQTVEGHGIRKVSILGSSMGAMIALEFALRYPEKVTCLILASLPLEQSPSLQYLKEKLIASTQERADEETFFKKLLPFFFSPNFIQNKRFEIYADFFIQNGASFSKKVLCSQMFAVNQWLESKRWMIGCSCPCLVIYGSEDRLTSGARGIEQAVRAFKKMEIKIIEGAGHAVQIERHQEFNKIVHEFLGRHTT